MLKSFQLNNIFFIITIFFYKKSKLNDYADNRYLQIFFPRNIYKIKKWTFFLSIFEKPRYFWKLKKMKVRLNSNIWETLGKL